MGTIIITAVLAALTWQWLKPPPVSPVDEMVDHLPGLVAKNGLHHSPGKPNETGSMENTYYVAYLGAAVGRTSDVIPVETVSAIHRAWDDGLVKRSVPESLMATAILSWAKMSEPRWETEAKEAANVLLAEPVTRNTVESTYRLLRLGQNIGGLSASITVEPFPIRTDKDRYLAWLVLNMPAYVENLDQLEQAFVGADDTAAQLLRDPQQHSLAEIHAALPIAKDLLSGVELPKLDSWFDDMRGCESFPHLYRPSPDSHFCTLQATVLAIETGLDL